jgi:hypothetical protein
MRKVLKALQSGMTYSAWEKAYGGKSETFKTTVRRLHARDLVTQDEVSGLWSPVQFEVEQELRAA